MWADGVAFLVPDEADFRAELWSSLSRHWKPLTERMPEHSEHVGRKVRVQQAFCERIRLFCRYPVPVSAFQTLVALVRRQRGHQFGLEFIREPIVGLEVMHRIV